MLHREIDWDHTLSHDKLLWFEIIIFATNFYKTCN